MPIINTSFFQTGANTSDATATASQILAPYTAYVASGKVTGTMPNNGPISNILQAGQSYQIPSGYTTGGTIQAASLSSQTVGTATQNDIMQVKTAWVNGTLLTGQISNTSIAYRLKNGEILFDGSSFSVKNAACYALVGAYSFIYNNNFRTLFIYSVPLPGGSRTARIVMIGYEIQPTEVTTGGSAIIVDGVQYFKDFQWDSPIGVTDYYDSNDYSNLYAIGMIQE